LDFCTVFAPVVGDVVDTADKPLGLEREGSVEE
jgi:hypothetical protein